MYTFIHEFKNNRIKELEHKKLTIILELDCLIIMMNNAK